MKRKLAVFFLLILSLPVLYKAGFFTFYQLNKDFIAENYCINKERPITMCYGKCFLEKGLGLADEKAKPNALVAQLKFEISEFVVDNLQLSIFPDQKSRSYPITSIPSLSDGVNLFIFHPPLV